MRARSKTPFERDQIRYLREAGERPIVGVRLAGEKVSKRSVDVFTFGEFLAQLDRVVRGLTAGLEGISLVLKGRIPRPPDAAPWRMLALGFGRSVIVEFGLGEPERLRISESGEPTSPTLYAVTTLGALIALEPDDAVARIQQFDDRIGNDFAGLLAILADNAIEYRWRTAGTPEDVEIGWESADRVRNALRAEIAPVTSVERVTGFLFRLDARTNDFKLQPDDESQAVTGHYDDILIPQLPDAWSHRVVAEVIRTEHRYAYAHSHSGCSTRFSRSSGSWSASRAIKRPAHSDALIAHDGRQLRRNRRIAALVLAKRDRCPTGVFCVAVPMSLHEKHQSYRASAPVTAPLSAGRGNDAFAQRALSLLVRTVSRRPGRWCLRSVLDGGSHEQGALRTERWRSEKPPKCRFGDACRPAWGLFCSSETNLAQPVRNMSHEVAYSGAMPKGDHRKALWIEVRNSETGERTVTLYDAPVPQNRAERERFLNRYVPMIFAGAELRTYAGGAGTFVARHLLITAHYGAIREDAELLPLTERLPKPFADGLGQGRLFAA